MRWLVTTERRVLIIDDDIFALTMLRSTLEKLDYVVVGEADSAALAIEVAKSTTPDIALVDLDLGEGPTGIDVANMLRKLDPKIGIVMLSTYLDPRFLGSAQQELPGGSIYLVKSSIADTQLLVDALQMAAETDRFNTAVTKISETHEVSPADKLSDQQLEVMRYIAAGFSNAEIAKRIWVTEAGIEKITARIIKQLGIKVGKEENQRIRISHSYHQLTGAVRARRV